MTPGAPLVVALTGTDVYGDIRTSAEARRSLSGRPAGSAAAHGRPGASRAVAAQGQGRLPVGAQAAGPRSAVARDLRGLRARAPAAGEGPAPRPRWPRGCSPRPRAFASSTWGRPSTAARPARAPSRGGREPALPLARCSPARAGACACWRAAGCSCSPRGWRAAPTSCPRPSCAACPWSAPRIAGSMGLLGADYRGYFPAGDTRALARLLARIEREPALYATLAARSRQLKPLFSPARERAAWRRLLAELVAVVSVRRAGRKRR